MSKELIPGELSAYCKLITKKFSCKGAIIIIQKENHEGQLIVQTNLSYEEIKNCLSIGMYYNEKEHIETENEMGGKEFSN